MTSKLAQEQNKLEADEDEAKEKRKREAENAKIHIQRIKRILNEGNSPQTS